MSKEQIKYLVEQLESVDDFLCGQEDYLHGKEGNECTNARVSVSNVIKQIKLQTQ